MPDSTDPTTATADGWCHWHDGPSGAARVVRLIPRQSGPDYALYACAPCREQRGLTPIGKPDESEAWRAYNHHIYECKSCTETQRCGKGQALWDTYQAALLGKAVAS